MISEKLQKILDRIEPCDIPLNGVFVSNKIDYSYKLLFYQFSLKRKAIWLLGISLIIFSILTPMILGLYLNNLTDLIKGISMFSIFVGAILIIFGSTYDFDSYIEKHTQKL